MLFPKTQALRLVIVDDSVEAAEAIVSTLRNDGLAVRPSRPVSTEELDQVLEGQPVDIVLAQMTGGSFAAEQVIQLVAARGKDVPVLALLDDVDAATLTRIRATGMRGCALRTQPQHLLNVVKAEWADLDTRRRLRRLEAQVRETERRCDALIHSSRDPIAYVHEGMHIRANAAYLEMFGVHDPEDIEGTSLLDLVAPEDVDAIRQSLKTLAKGGSMPPQDLQARAMDGERFNARIEFSQASYEGESCLQVVFRHQEGDAEYAQELEELMQRDPVTGLLNRGAFIRELEQAVAEVTKQGHTHGLLLVEPDHYPRLLQTIGFDSADALLQATSERLREALDDDTAVLGRFSEHALTVLLPRSEYHATANAAERIREAFASHVFDLGVHSANLTVSIGGVQIGERIASVNPILSRATENVRSAAGVGGNRVELFDAGAVDRAEAERIQAWVERLRDALEKDWFRLHYQPVISLQGEPGAMYECLLRLDHGDRELVLPDNFMAIAADHDLLPAIDRWVITHAIQAAAEQQRQGRPVTLMVKISQPSLAQPQVLAEAMREDLQRHGLDAERIVLELPESKVFANLNETRELIQALSAFGGRLCLERFGTGLDSFQLLSHLQDALPAMLKIDRSFTEDLATAPESRQKVDEMARRAGELGMRTIAEFVNDAAAMSQLFSAGVDYVQGAFLALPGPAMDYEFE